MVYSHINTLDNMYPYLGFTKEIGEEFLDVTVRTLAGLADK